MYMYGMYDTRNKTIDVIGCSHSPLLFVLLLLLTFQFTLLALDVSFTVLQLITAGNDLLIQQSFCLTLECAI